MMSSSCTLLLWSCILTPLSRTVVVALSRSSPNSSSHELFLNSRPDFLNLLNHPLQLQLATGELPLGSFRRLVVDRAVILEGLEVATGGMLFEAGDQTDEHDILSSEWFRIAEAADKTIVVPGIACYYCGGEHLNIDCPNDDDSQEASSTALALKSVLMTCDLIGALAVLRSYSFACAQLLEAVVGSSSKLSSKYDQTVYHGWLKVHADKWSKLADQCEMKIEQSDGAAADASSYSICLSLLYNWIDGEAATTGIRSTSNNDSLAELLSIALEELEPGYAAQRDKHQSFVADINGRNAAENQNTAASAKVDAAAAYLAARRKKK